MEVPGFKKKKFVRESGQFDDKQEAKRSALEDQERLALGQEVSEFYGQLTAASPTARTGHEHAFDEHQQGGFYCSICQEVVHPKIERATHIRSTVHLINDKYQPGPVYGIPADNVGYQMLIHKYDWEQDRGLGKRGDGRLEPLPTRLKSDRKGVGHAETRPLRITHFPSSFDGTKLPPCEDKRPMRIEGECKKSSAAKKRTNLRISRQQKRARAEMEKDKEQAIKDAVYNEFGL